MRSGHAVAVASHFAGLVGRRVGGPGGLLAALACAAACSGKPSSASRGEAGSDEDGAATAIPAPPAVDVPAPRPLGLPSIDAFGYRRGPGRDAYARAVKAEKAARGDADWQVVVDACRAALAADPDHLDAAWLLAAALARLGAHDQIVEPLSRAIAGDWGKWGERSLTLPLFEGFLASPHGAAWRELAEGYRAAFAEAARRAVVVLGREAGGDRRTEVYGWDPEAGRWLRLSRTGGTVVAAVPGPTGAGVVAYVAYRDLARRADRRGALARPRVAVIELASGRVSRELAFADVDELRLGWRAGGAGEDPALIARVTGGKDAGAWTLDWKRAHKKRPAAGQKATVPADALAVARGQVRRLRLPVDGVTADWDDDGLASAIRIDATRKTVAPPAGLVIDGHALAWSPDRARLALIAMPDGDCAAPATLFVVDAATGKLRRLAEAAAPAPAWVDATHLAYTDGDRVLLVDVTAGAPAIELTSAGGVATAIVDRPCAPPEEEALFAGPVDEDPAEPEDAEPGAGP